MAKNVLVTNIVANTLTRIWNVISLYVFVPIWIHFLGVDGYGIISFYSILMTFLHFADAGLSATLTRELARADKDQKYKIDLLTTIERVYVAIALFVFFITFIGAGVIVDSFLKSDVFSRDELIVNVKIMGCIMAFNFVLSLYNGGFIGLQKMIYNNAITIVYGILRGAVVVLLLIFIPTVKAFFLWQLFSVIICVLYARYKLYSFVEIKGEKGVFNLGLFKGIWKYSFGMMLMGILAPMISQIDKMITGNIFTLTELGFYSLASSIGQSVVFLTQPICGAFFPELTRLISLKNEEVVKAPFLLLTFFVSAISCGVGLVLFLYTGDFVYIWTQNTEIVSNIVIPTRILLACNIFVALQFSAYYLALACGHVKTNVKFNLFSIIFMLPAVYYFTKEWGINATPIPYLLFNIIVTVYMGFLVVKRFLPSLFVVWWKYTVMPLLISFFVQVVFFFIVDSLFINCYVRLILGTLIGCFTIILTIILFLRKNREYLNYGIINKAIQKLPSWLFN